VVELIFGLVSGMCKPRKEDALISFAESLGEYTAVMGSVFLSADNKTLSLVSRKRIFSVNLATPDKLERTPGSFDDYYARFSPDGKMVVFDRGMHAAILGCRAQGGDRR